MWTADARAFVPRQIQPSHRLENARHHRVGRALGVCVFDAQEDVRRDAARTAR